ncbi:MAG: amine oxidase [Ramlibacter sp.]|jgi:protoporphyrinogen oxidase|nr:amine oxidase [Ramlibacter sp.]MDB5915646.1 amine oxidase [Ramlibacter sp.]
MNQQYEVVIIGAGPAGLTAALELQDAGIRNVAVLESDGIVGGISRTVQHHGNRIDIGGHRFFSKSDWVMQWWNKLLPAAADTSAEPRSFQYQGQTRDSLPVPATADPASDDVMLLRSRLSRIYYGRQFFDYPLKLNVETLLKLGVKRTFLFGISYMAAHLRPIKPEQSLEDFLVNRFGRRLYLQFFKEYTEKVWGVPCSQISAEWGAQRIKSLSIAKALLHAARKALGGKGGKAEQTSLIESFLYPKFGPGQMWEVAARRFVQQGGTLLMNHKAVALDINGDEVRSVTAQHAGGTVSLGAKNVVSTMPIKDLVEASAPSWPPHIVDIARNLQYRDFITVGLLYKGADVKADLKDNWIYIQEPGVSVGRVQVFNNWSPFMVADPSTVWLGLEFFCRETDALWKMSDAEMTQLALEEMQAIGLANTTAALDSVVIRVPKAYPGYFGDAYGRFDELQQALSGVRNLFPVGRNGMHRYNNQDHSMLTAKKAVELIAAGDSDKSGIWSINVDDEYHEERK